MDFFEERKRLFVYAVVFGCVLSFIILLSINFSFSYIFMIFVSLGFMLNPDVLVIISYVLLLSYLLFFGEAIFVKRLGVASLVSICWLLIANSQYGYNQSMMYFFGFNSFPLFAWAFGLFSVYFLYGFLIDEFEFNGFLWKFVGFLVFYWILLLSVETVAYHVFDIRNLATAMYSGLPLCDCLHAPFWMQLSYLLMGPFYYVLCNFFVRKA